MFQHRVRVLLVILSVFFLTLALRLYQLQVVRGDEFRRRAENNIIRREVLPTVRGCIRDRNGVALAVDRIDYEVAVSLGGLESLDDSDDWRRTVARALQLPEETVREAARHATQEAQRIAGRAKTPERQKADLAWIKLVLPQPLFSDVTREQVMRLELNEFRLPTYTYRKRTLPVFSIRDHTRRVYPQGPTAAHLVGYMMPVTEKEYLSYRESYDGSPLKKYRMDENIGRSGLEAFYNSQLRGSRGERLTLVDVRGRRQRLLEVTPPRPGQDVQLTLDVRLQRLVEKTLDQQLHALESTVGHMGAAVVIMDPRNGDVLACVTSPRFDPNRFREDYATLSADTSMTPYIDRARQGLYPLGSVFKVVVALAGLESGKLTGSTEFTCNRFFRLPGGRTRQCTWLHGRLRLVQALEQSCNIYFYQAGLKVGGQDLQAMAERLGLGERTGLDGGEARGFVPLPAGTAETLNLSIGGGRLLVTPLQAARMMCVLVDGKLPRPRLSRTQTVQLTDVGLNPQTLSTVRWGMHDVVHGSQGTARTEGRVPGLTYAAKTGTANLGTHGQYDAWYCGFAPFENPKVAFAAVIERTGEHGGKVAAPVIREVFKTMLRDPELREYLVQENHGESD